VSSAIQNILNRAIGDGARPTKYEVAFAFIDPQPQVNNDDLVVMGKTATFPGKEHTTMDFKFKGRSIPIKGQIKYTQTWECTFYLTEDHVLKNAFENWIEALDQQHNYYDVSGNSNVQNIQHQPNYTTEIVISQLNFRADRVTANYRLHNAFPTVVSPVQTSYESRGQLQEFSVTFAYSHYTSEVKRGKDDNFIDEIVGKATQALKDSLSLNLNKLGAQINNFVSNNVGETLSKLNTWANNFNSSSGISDQRSAQHGGAGPNTQVKTLTAVGIK